ncbi:MAG: HNH endonuclease [Clostridia bacterium]|nr:HNH endonuclease [Clostridia bacterium]
MAKIFTQEMIEFVRSNTKDRTTLELTNLINERFNTQFTVKQVHNCKSNHSLPSGMGNYTQFKQGQKAWNKGLKMSEETKAKIRATKTMFEVGHVPHQTLPLGTERKNKEGYIEIKVQFSKYSTAGGRGKCSTFDTFWIGKHKKIWIDTYGNNIPPKHKIIFLDKNKYNFDINNLACVSNAQHAIMCRKGRYTEFAEVTKCNKTLTELEQAIKRKV